MAEAFLSCDKSYAQTAYDNQNKKKKDSPPNMITISTTPTNLSTDGSGLIRKRPPAPPRVCCVLSINAISLFGVALTSVLSLAAYVIVMIRLFEHKDHFNMTRMIALLSIFLFLELIFAILFCWGLFTTRHRLLIPFILLSFFLLFAIAGVFIIIIVTYLSTFGSDGDKYKDKNYDNGYSIAIRVVICCYAILESFLVYCFIRSFFYVRTINKFYS